MSVIVRFAPSPTGFLHIGGARTALFNYLFAKHHGGKFLLRIEDTDKERSSAVAIDAILKGLNWLDLKTDGNVVMQSENINRHQEIAKKMLEKGTAYFCYTSTQELEEMRLAAEKQGKIFRFKSPWRNKVLSQHSVNVPVIRLKAPIAGQTTIKDLVQGEIVVQNSELDDLVLLRSDGTPTYMLSVVVDDYDMQISHIIRGDDHLTNAFRQKVIYEANGWKVPTFAHIPLIHGADGAKLSKRHGATSVIEYQKMGYLPETMRNYLLRLGWASGDLEIISDEEAIRLFDLDKVGKSPSRFDFAKLNHLNRHYLKQKSSTDLYDLCKEFLSQNMSEIEKNRCLRVINFAKEKVDLIPELAKICEIFLDNFNQEISSSDQKIIAEKKPLLESLNNVLNSASNWSNEQIKVVFDEFSSKQNVKVKDFGQALRICLTFSSSSAGGIFEIVEILGKAETLRRMQKALI